VARHGGLSADHLEYLSQDGIDAMARAGTVAVLLPGAYYFLRETMPPDLVEEVEDSDEAFDRMRERVSRPPRREVDDA